MAYINPTQLTKKGLSLKNLETAPKIKSKSKKYEKAKRGCPKSRGQPLYCFFANFS
jgi:hypothetical protein